MQQTYDICFVAKHLEPFHYWLFFVIYFIAKFDMLQYKFVYMLVNLRFLPISFMLALKATAYHPIVPVNFFFMHRKKISSNAS